MTNTPISNTLTSGLTTSLDDHLNDAEYVYVPYIGDMQIGGGTVVTHAELLRHVNDYNHGTLGCSDAWFDIYTVEGDKLDISDFYSQVGEAYLLELEKAKVLPTRSELRVARQAPIMVKAYGVGAIHKALGRTYYY